MLFALVCSMSKYTRYFTSAVIHKHLPEMELPTITTLLPIKVEDYAWRSPNPRLELLYSRPKRTKTTAANLSAIYQQPMAVFKFDNYYRIAIDTPQLRQCSNYAETLFWRTDFTDT